MPRTAFTLLAALASLAAAARAQAQERSVPPQEKPMPPFEEMLKMRVVHALPGMERAARRSVVYSGPHDPPLHADVYAPPDLAPGSRLPVVVFVHGGPVLPTMSPKDWGVFVSYGQLAAASGFLGVSFNHRFYAGERIAEAGADVSALVAYVRAHAAELGADPERIALWVFSGGGPFLSIGLRADAPAYYRCLVSYYAVLDIQTPAHPSAPDALGPERRRQWSPLHHLASGARIPPLLVARAGQDNPALNATVDAFVQQALARNAPLELLNHPAGRHAFDMLDDDPRSREIVRRTLEFLKEHL
jgi:acetyl esterase/lipase